MGVETSPMSPLDKVTYSSQGCSFELPQIVMEGYRNTGVPITGGFVSMRFFRTYLFVDCKGGKGVGERDRKVVADVRG